MLKPEVGKVVFLAKDGQRGVIVRQDQEGSAVSREIYFNLSKGSLRLRPGQLVQFVVKQASTDSPPQADQIEPLSS